MLKKITFALLGTFTAGTILATEYSAPPYLAAQHSNMPAMYTLAAANTDPLMALARQTKLGTNTNQTLDVEQFAQQTLSSSAAYRVVPSLQKAKEAIATDRRLQYIIVSDGRHHALFKKSNTDAALQYTWNGNVWETDFTETGYIPVIAFADSLQGDVTAAFQAAATLAAKRKAGLEFPYRASYTVNNDVDIPNGVRYIHGNYSVLTARNIPPKGNMLNLARGIADIEISNFTLNLAEQKAVTGVFAVNPRNVAIRDMRFINIAFRGINIYNSKNDIKNIIIENNIMQADSGSKNNKGETYPIAISNTLSIPPKYRNARNPIWQQYVEEGTVAENPNTVSDIHILNNRIRGGYYGIMFNGVSNSIISGNTITDNMRNISLQNNAGDNTITSNNLNNSLSSGIHLAYNSSNNTVSNNTIVSERATGQGLLQAYQSSRNNTFTNNSIEILNKNGPGWVLYAGTGSSNTTFERNLVDSAMTRSLIGVEAVWDSRSSQNNPSAYMMQTTVSDYASNQPFDYSGGKGSLSNIHIQNNIFLPRNKQRPLLYIGADRSSGHNNNEQIIGNVDNLAFSDNNVLGNNYSELITQHKNGAAITGLNTRNNTTHNGRPGNYSKASDSSTLLANLIGSLPSNLPNHNAKWTYSTTSYTLGNGLANLHLVGPQALSGSGNDGDNIIVGNAYNNILNGMGGNDILIGGYGSDTLTGGSGADVFVFSSTLNGKADRITDFNLTEDKIGLSQTTFGLLKGIWFSPSLSALQDDTRVFQSGNTLYYDADGPGTYFQPVPFAILSSTAPLNSSHFILLK